MEKSDKFIQLNKVSNIKKVIDNFKKYIGDDQKSLYISNKYSKKFMIIHENRYVHFGSIYFPDFTYTKNEHQRQRYLKRANATKGWRNNKYSPQNLAINCLYM